MKEKIQRLNYLAETLYNATRDNYTVDSRFEIDTLQLIVSDIQCELDSIKCEFCSSELPLDD